MGKFNSPHEFVFFFAGVDERNMAGHRIKSILLNVPDHTQTEGSLTHTRELVKSASAKYVMLDSGGFELLQAEKKGLAISHNPKAPIVQRGKFNITPEHVIEAAQKLKPDIVVALDYPIKTLKGEQEREGEFRLKLKFNVKWAIRTAELREKYCPQIKLFIPVQCYDLRQVDIFFKRIKGINYGRGQHACEEFRTTRDTFLPDPFPRDGNQTCSPFGNGLILYDCSLCLPG